MKKTVFILSAVLAAGMLAGCQFPYEPKTEPPVVSEIADTTSRMYEVNRNYQVCNPSITQDQVNYPGCMLWLGFADNLGVSVPSQWQSEYNTTGVVQHDRLTICDTKDSVRWFVKRPLFVTGEFQDPEWSFNPDYIVTLASIVTGGSIYNGHAVRISDKAWLKWNERKLMAQSDPYLWLPDNITSTAVVGDSDLVYDTAGTGLVGKGAIRAFFGTDSVKFAFIKPNDGGLFRINFVDFDVDSPVVTALAIPSGKGEWNCENPQISPDGKWVAYHIVLGNDYAAYIQQLIAGSQPVLIGEGASWPHWWKDPADGSFWIAYSTNGGEIRDAYIEGSNGDGSIGNTYIRKAQVAVSVSGEAPPSWTIFKEPAITLAKWPFRGGLSRDGRYLCTGLVKAYIYDLK